MLFSVMKMKHIFIVNPEAGKPGAAMALLPEIEKAAAAFPEKEIEIYKTTGPLDATRYVRERAQAEEGEIRFYACGGDGTLGEVVNGAKGLGNAAVGCVPVGTGNDFVRNFSGPAGSFTEIESQLFGEAATDYVRVSELTDRKIQAEDILMNLYEEEEELDSGDWQ